MSQIKHYINPEIVSDPGIFLYVKKSDVICTVCNGLFNNPEECEKCLISYCKLCFPTHKCAQNGGKITSLKNINCLMELVKVTCEGCNTKHELLNYNQHLEECRKEKCNLCGMYKEKNSACECVVEITKDFCQQYSLSFKDIFSDEYNKHKNLELEFSSLTNKYNKLRKEFQKLKQDKEENKENLNNNENNDSHSNNDNINLELPKNGYKRKKTKVIEPMLVLKRPDYKYFTIKKQFLVNNKRKTFAINFRFSNRDDTEDKKNIIIDFIKIKQEYSWNELENLTKSKKFFVKVIEKRVELLSKTEYMNYNMEKNKEMSMEENINDKINGNSSQESINKIT